MFFKSLKEYESLNDTNDIAYIYNRIAAVYFEKNNLNFIMQSISLVKKSLALQKTIDNKDLLISNYNLLGA